MRGQIEEGEARRGAYAKAYGSTQAGYEAEAMQGKREREIKAVGLFFSTTNDISKSHGAETANSYAEQVHASSPEVRKYIPVVPKITKTKGKPDTWEIVAMEDTQTFDGTPVKKGSKILVEVNDQGEPGRILGVKSTPKGASPAMTEDQAVEKYKTLHKELLVVESNPMNWAGNSDPYIKAILQQMERVKKSLPADYPLVEMAPSHAPSTGEVSAASLAGAFDPESSEYDMKSAKAAGLGPDETGHWPSRDPQTGLILKGSGHPTFNLTIEGERDAGYEIHKGEDGRYYSKPTAKAPIAPPPSTGKEIVRTGVDNATGR